MKGCFVKRLLLTNNGLCFYLIMVIVLLSNLCILGWAPSGPASGSQVLCSSPVAPMVLHGGHRGCTGISISSDMKNNFVVRNDFSGSIDNSKHHLKLQQL